jgi:hypothetical protein
MTIDTVSTANPVNGAKEELETELAPGPQERLRP